MRRLLWLLCPVIAIVATLSDVEARTTWDKTTAQAPRVGLIVGAFDQETRTSADELVRLIDEQGGIVVAWPPMWRGDENVPDDLLRLRERAEQSFFFEGASVTRDLLSQPVEELLLASREWMASREASKLLFETAIFLVRAHQESEESRSAQKVMELLVRTLPAHEPDQRVVPPAVVELWTRVVEEQRGRTQGLDRKRWTEKTPCRLSINGGDVEKDVLYVDGDRSYILGLECPDRETRRWWVAGSRLDELPSSMLVDGVSAENWNRLATESSLGSHLDLLVFVGPGECDSQPAQPCVALHDRAGRATAIRADGRAVRDELSRALTMGGPKMGGPMERRIQWLPVGASVAGTVLIGTGAILLHANMRRDRAFACSPATSRAVDPELCTDVEPFSFSSRQERDAMARSIAWGWLGAGLTLAAGVSSLVVGVVTFADERKKISLHPTGRGVAVKLSF